LFYMSLLGNLCIDRSFLISDVASRNEMLAALETCFMNFVETPLELNCEYSYTANEYGCTLNDIMVTHRSRNLVIVGQHLEGHSDDDVEVITITNSNTPFIIPQFFDVFPNLNEMIIIQSNLQSLEFPENAELVWLALSGNNISRIEDGTFEHLNQLLYLDMQQNGIEEIGENAFAGLEHLATLALLMNHISVLHPRVLHPLTSLSVFDIFGNELSSIGAETFEMNANLDQIFLDFNRINGISREFLANTDRLNILNLMGNSCVNHVFFLHDDESWDEMNAALETCFRNFEGPEERQVIMSFQGPISFYDQQGNRLASF